MPELPEVETIKRGLQPRLQGLTISKAIVRFPNLRWPIPENLSSLLQNQTILDVERRGKYLIFKLTSGNLIVHLGMSGSLRLLSADKPIVAHDHVDILLSSGQILRYNDPRRFGAILWSLKPEEHPLLQSIGLEPFSSKLTGAYLKQKALKRNVPIKTFLMNGKIIAGVGNIYAAEALFLTNLDPRTPAKFVSLTKFDELVEAVRIVLQKSLDAGGTTLKDYVNSEGKPGYFAQQLSVYGRKGLACRICETILEAIQLGQRATVFCPTCQKLIQSEPHETRT